MGGLKQISVYVDRIAHTCFFLCVFYSNPANSYNSYTILVQDTFVIEEIILVEKYLIMFNCHTSLKRFITVITSTFLFILISITISTAKVSNYNENVQIIVLKPDRPVNNLQMPSYNGEAKIVFEDLVPNTKYDIKISYPGTTPTQFIFLKPEELVRHNRLRRRRLLDTEKFGISTTSNTNNVGPIYLHTEKYGVSYDPNIEKRPIRFNIVLETVVFGIPKEAFRLIFVVVLALLVTYKYYFPFLKSILNVQSISNEGKYAKS